MPKQYAGSASLAADASQTKPDGAEMKIFCHVEGRLPAEIHVSENRTVAACGMQAPDDLRRLAMTLVECLTPDQIIFLVFQLQSWQRMVLLQHLYEEALGEDKALTVLLHQDPIAFEYRKTDPSASLEPKYEVETKDIDQFGIDEPINLDEAEDDEGL